MFGRMWKEVEIITFFDANLLNFETFSQYAECRVFEPWPVRTMNNTTLRFTKYTHSLSAGL